MISILVRISLLIGITICLAEGTSGADIENKEVLSAPINNPINNVEEGAIKFNVLKREAIPDEKRGKNENNKQVSPKKRKKKTSRKSKKGVQKNKVKKNNKQPKRGNGKKKPIGKNRKNMKSKRGKWRNKHAKKNGNKKYNNKNKTKKKRKLENKQLSKKGKKKKNVRTKNKAWRKGKVVNSGGKRQNRQCPSDCTITISDSIKIYRKYLNHDRKIKRTTKWLTTITTKGSASKRKKFEEDADWLASVTNNGTDCPANPLNNTKVITTVAGLRECASDTGPIAKLCNINVIPNVTLLQEKQNLCVTTPPSFASYQGWIDGVTVCFETTRTCQCFTDMNGPNNILPNVKPYSCQFPNNPPDWINAFSTATKKALNNCKAEVKSCNELGRQACQLASTCCANAADGATTAASGNLTTAASGRRMKIKASMIKQLHKMNIH